MMGFKLIKKKRQVLKGEEAIKEIAEAKKKEEYLKVKKQKEKAEKRKERKTKHSLKYFLTKAGIEIDSKKVAIRVFNITIVINLILSAYLVYFFSRSVEYTLTYIIVIMIVLWVLAFALILFVLWIMLYVMLDFKMMQRRLSLEEVLPDFLQLTASNIKSGMPIDQALWYAVRPRFGILAKEIEIVAKETMSGKDLDEALIKFGKKYDSPTLKRAVSLINEGLKAGGEIADLVMKIATDIKNTKIMKKEMAASVVSYVIFIGFATVGAAPFLFGLAAQLISIVQGLSSTMEMPTGMGGGMGISISGGGIDLGDFKIFAAAMLGMTSLFSASIISIIQKGNIKEGIKYIPIFITISISLFFIVMWAMDKLFAGFF